MRSDDIVLAAHRGDLQVTWPLVTEMGLMISLLLVNEESLILDITREYLEQSGVTCR